MGILANENSISAGGYTIERSLRFQSASSQYATRTFATSGTSNTIKTFSFWVKRGSLGSRQSIFSAYDGSSGNSFHLEWESTDTFQLFFGGAAANEVTTTQVFRDPSAWYHIVAVFDTTQATASNRYKLYVNGTQVTTFSVTSYPPQNSTVQFGLNNGNNRIGTWWNASTAMLDGYLAEVNFIDGQALTPSSFGETDALTGVWVAKKYTGTYGTNGFYLPFNDGTSTTTLGQDRSGNANNWTLTNFTRSAGVSDCWMYDVPSGNGSPSATQPSSNYPTWNPLKVYTNSLTISNSNLTASDATANITSRIATMALPTSGKYYFEMVATTISASLGMVGVIDSAVALGNSSFQIKGCYRSGGQIYNLAGTIQTSGSSYTSGDVIGVAVDVGAGTVQFYKNNVAQGATPSFTFTAGTELYPFVATDNNAGTKTYNANFGQRSFSYTPPSGFKALCTANLPAPTIAKGNQYMDATLYTGNGGSQTIANAGGFSPDLVWTKARSTPSSHQLYNSVTGVNIYLKSNSTDAEVSLANTLTSFNSNGFTLGSNDSGNQSGTTAVAWQWDAGSSTVTNTSGTISSQVRANTTAGFSIVTYTGTGANATVGHGLGVAPKMVIVKRRDNGIGATNWYVYHAGVNAGVNPQQYNLKLNLTSAQAGLTAAWNDTAPTSTVFTVGTNSEINGSGGTFVAYVFSEIAGFSRFGSYTGNGSTDGPFIYTGFRPKFIMTKGSSVADAWQVFDTSRDTYNAGVNGLQPNTANAEASPYPIDYLANGFKIRGTNPVFNTSGGTFIFMAFAESPFNFSNAR